MIRMALGIDIGGTRTKMGLVNLGTGSVTVQKIFNTHKESEEAFLQSLKLAYEELTGVSRQLFGAGVSIGSYVFEDGRIDGMSSFVPFMTENYPLVKRIEEALGLPVRADNDARLIGLAESRYGAGRGYARSMTITLGTGIGIGLCVDGRPLGGEAFFHLAGHIKVRSGGEYPCLDDPPCYCGLSGCFESTCSGAALEKYVHNHWQREADNRSFFAAAVRGGVGSHTCFEAALRDECGNPLTLSIAEQDNAKVSSILEWYLRFLTEALNQYIYLYCPDVIVLGGGVAKGLAPWEEEINRRVTARVHNAQHPIIKISTLMEEGGIRGAASLFDSSC
jgi:predicted NBD/HSP70 family sugar kinase